jgi:hypothetical protein
MVVDDQYSDANHRNPHCRGTIRTGTAPEVIPGPLATRKKRCLRRTAAAVLEVLPPLRASYPTVSPPDQHRPPPALFIRVRPGARSGR